MPRFGTMKLFTISVVGFFLAVLFGLVLSAQTPAQAPAASSDVAQLEALAKKIDAQNAKIDTLSQQILKLEQQIAHIRPGVMIGEGASPATGATSAEPPRPAEDSQALGEPAEPAEASPALTRAVAPEAASEPEPAGPDQPAR